MHSETDEEEIQDVEDEAVVDVDADVSEEAVDEIDESDPEQTVVMSEDSFSDPDISMEVNVEKLVAELEGSDDDDAHRKAEIRHRLEELADEGSLEDTYAIDLDDDD